MYSAGRGWENHIKYMLQMDKVRGIDWDRPEYIIV